MTRKNFELARKYLNEAYQELKQKHVIGEDLQLIGFRTLKKAVRIFRDENQKEGGEVLKG